jgi:phosphatidylinositol kinase/protein kinase (PI-3  family)
VVEADNAFSRSAAQLSIVGYVIGLGDRQPSNVLIDRISGRVVHIDSGDCFERAEVVPFRLTRMMVRARRRRHRRELQVYVREYGNVLRENRQVLEMVLLRFVHAPLVDPNEVGEDGDRVVPVAPRPMSKVPTGSVVATGSFT